MHDPAVVRAEYADETRLAARKAAHAGAEGPELYELIGRDSIPSRFTAEDAEEILPRHFGQVERRDAHGWIVFPDADAAQVYLSSLVALEGARVPPVDGEIRARRLPSIFVAERS